MTLLIAHRTCPRDACENSLAGMTLAANLGCDAVEIDVRTTKDGVPVLMHDIWLWRTTRRLRRVSQVCAAELAELTLLGGDEPPPTFAAALDHLPTTMSLAVELKDSRSVDAVLREVAQRQLESRVWIWSEKPDVVRRAVAHRPAVEVALLRDTWTPWTTRRTLDRAAALGAQAVSLAWRRITPTIARAAHSRGLRLYSYCKRGRIDPGRKELIDGLITDFPSLANS